MKIGRSFQATFRLVQTLRMSTFLIPTWDGPGVVSEQLQQVYLHHLQTSEKPSRKKIIKE